MKKVIFIVLLIQASIAVSAQKLTTITGTVMEDTNLEKLGYATVVLKKDTSIVDLVVTENNGVFNIENIQTGSYNLEFSYVGYEDRQLNLEIDGSKRKINLGDIVLKIGMLDEIEVVGEPTSNVSLRLDKKVFTVGKDVLTQSGSATDVLESVPSVAVDPTGAVSLRGNNNVLILINGKQSGLTLTQSLEQIPSSSIDRVEVITNPSSKFDAAGTAGIINIILKKNKDEGFSGSLRLITGIPAEHRVNGNLNYKKGKLNIFSNWGVRYSDYVGLYTKDLTITDDNGASSFLEQREDQDRHDDGILAYIGFDYSFNDKNSITAAYYRNGAKDTDETEIVYDYFTTEKDSSLLTIGNSVQKRNYNQFEFNYSKAFDKEGRQLSVDFQYDFWNSVKDWDIKNSQEFPNVFDIATIETNTEERSDDIVARADFVTPITEKDNLELGVKYENRLVKNAFFAESFSGATTKLLADNDIDYDEQIAAAYAQYGRSLKKFEFQVGLRLETTNITIEDAEDIYRQKFDYTRLFPSASMSYSLSDNKSFQLSYSSRISRPFLSYLNPFPEIQDFNFMFLGNPNLLPSFSDNLEFSFLFIGDKITVNPSLYYAYSTDHFQNFVSQNDENGAYEATIINMDYEHRYGMEVSASYRPAKWLRLNGEVNFFKYDEKGSFANQNLDFSNQTWNSTLVASINPISDLSFQSKFYYEGKSVYKQYTSRPLYYLDIGVSKGILKGNGNISTKVTNILDTRKNRDTITGPNFSYDEVFNPNAARWILVFQYRFRGNKDRRANSSNRD